MFVYIEFNLKAKASCRRPQQLNLEHVLVCFLRVVEAHAAIRDFLQVGCSKEGFWTTKSPEYELEPAFKQKGINLNRNFIQIRQKTPKMMPEGTPGDQNGAKREPKEAKLEAK